MAQDAVFIQARHRLEQRLELGIAPFDLVTGSEFPRAKAQLEKAVQYPDHLRVAIQHADDIGLRIRHLDLVQIAAVGPKQHGLFPCQLGAQHQAVESVVVDLPIPGLDEGVDEELPGRRRDLTGTGGSACGEVMDPDLPRGVADPVRPFAEHTQPHVFQHRDDLRQRYRLPRRIEAHVDMFSLLDHRVVEVHDQAPVLTCTLDALDVADGDTRMVVLAIAAGKSCRVFVQIARRHCLVHLAEQCRTQAVLPGDRGLHNAILEFREIVNGL